ncbi:MAG: endolytic transglycosylase MltG [Candidatus Krumholzibacteria bacterium]|nr:endolytic transglycosylase MltG [Candidatus Krumholzibacteria bacterium]
MIKRWATVAGVAFLLGLVIVLWGWRLWTGPGPSSEVDRDSGPVSSTVQMRIPPGMTLSAAADSLAALGLLKHPKVFLAGARLTGKGRALRTGLYELPVGGSPRDLLLALTTGSAVQVKVTIPEGLDVGEIADIVSRELGFSRDDFLSAADSLVMSAAYHGRLMGGDGPTVEEYDSLLAAESARHPRQFRWCEGYLAPDTFHFAEGTNAARAAHFLVSTQFARLDSVMADSESAKALELSGQELLALASIVEAEARRDDERALIAAVYVNRLRQGRRLEADPTVAFILEKKGKRLFYRDLEVASPFNTYRNKGLPPGPIGSPGFAALEAAAHPDSSCRAMYFVSDGQDGHVFSRTAREHEAAVQKFRRTRAGDRRNQNN